MLTAQRDCFGRFELDLSKRQLDRVMGMTVLGASHSLNLPYVDAHVGHEPVGHVRWIWWYNKTHKLQLFVKSRPENHVQTEDGYWKDEHREIVVTPVIGYCLKRYSDESAMYSGQLPIIVQLGLVGYKKQD